MSTSTCTSDSSAHTPAITTTRIHDPDTVSDIARTGEYLPHSCIRRSDPWALAHHQPRRPPPLHTSNPSSTTPPLATPVSMPPTTHCDHQLTVFYQRQIRLKPRSTMSNPSSRTASTKRESFDKVTPACDVSRPPRRAMFSLLRHSTALALTLVAVIMVMIYWWFLGSRDRAAVVPRLGYVAYRVTAMVSVTSPVKRNE
jgi:hypothetical protein